MIDEAGQRRAEQAAMQVLNKVWNDVMGGSQASYRYYQRKGDKNMYFWTTEKIEHKGHKRYVSGVYRYIKYRKTWTPLYLAGFAHKRDAKARALKLFHREGGE